MQQVTDAVGNSTTATRDPTVDHDYVRRLRQTINLYPGRPASGINASRGLDGTPVVVGLTGTGAVAGDRLTINWGGQEVNYTLVGGRHLRQQRDGDGATRDDPRLRARRYVQRGRQHADRRSGQR